jgi:hypothetical protein
LWLGAAAVKLKLPVMAMTSVCAMEAAGGESIGQDRAITIGAAFDLRILAGQLPGAAVAPSEGERCQRQAQLLLHR